MIAIFISKDDDEYKAYCSMPILSKVDESILISKTCPERVPYRLININGLTNIVCNGDSKYFPSKQSAMRKGWIKSEDYFLIFISVLYAIVKSRYLEENEGVYIFAHMGGNANFVNLELAAEKIIKCVPELRGKWYFSMLSAYDEKRSKLFDLKHIILPTKNESAVGLYKKFEKFRLS